MKNKTLVLALACALPLGVMAQKRAVTIRDVYRITSVNGVALSPDAKRIVYSAGNTSLQTLKSNRRIVVADCNGGNATDIVVSENCASPMWSTDGRSVYYTDMSTDSTAMQLYVYDLSTRESRALTSYALGVADGVVSPDGRYVAFSAEVYPEFGADAERTMARRKSKDTGRVHAHLADSLLYRHWTEYADGRVTHLMVCDLGSGEVTDVTPGTQTLLFTPSGDRLFAWSPDSRELCYVSNHDSHHEASTNADLWLVPVTGGTARCITSGNKAWDGTPLYSPDGRYIAYRSQAIPGYESDCFRLSIYDRQQGTHRVLTGHFDNWVEDFAWSADSRTIYFNADVNGYMPIYQTTLDGRITRLVPDVVAGSVVTDSRGTFFFTSSTTGKPIALYRHDTKQRRTTQLTHYNDALEAEVDFRPSEVMWVRGAGGDSVQCFIVKPHGFDPSKRYPLVMNVHGGPQMQWMNSFRADWQVYPGAGYVVAYPNPHGSTGRGQAFCAAISGDWGGKVFEDVMLVADALEQQPYVDPDRMAAMGWSYGGYMMNWIQGHTRRFKCLASMMGLYDVPSMWGTTEELWFPNHEFNGQPWNSDLYQKWNPAAYSRQFATPTLILTGERDYRVSYTQSLQYFNTLQTMGIPSRLIVFSNDGHWPSNMRSMPVYYNAHLEWFHRWLGGDPAPWDTQMMINNEVEY